MNIRIRLYGTTEVHWEALGERRILIMKDTQMLFDKLET